MTFPFSFLLIFEQNAKFVAMKPLNLAVFHVKKKAIHSFYSEIGGTSFLLAV